MKRKIKHAFALIGTQVTGNRLAQSALSMGTNAAQYFLGIGSGSLPGSSGEMAVLRLVRKRLTRPDGICIFDVGANNGQFLSILLRVFSGTCPEVHAFEPSSTAFDRLKAAYGETSSIRLNNCGLSDVAGEHELFYDSAGSGMASLLRRDVRHLGVTFSESERIRLTTLDAYVRTNGVQGIDLLKMDVEGSELKVLHGAKELFSRAQVRSVLFEFGGCNIDSRTYLRDFYHFFGQFNGMRFYRLTPSGYLFPIKGYSEDLEQFRTSNFFVVLDSKVMMP